MNNNLKGFLLEIIPKKLLINLKKIHYFLSLKHFDQKNEPDFKVLKSIIKEGDKVIDIGSNIGAYTKFLSGLVSENGLVLSIEPIPETFEILKSCVKRLKLNNVQLLNYAISSNGGKSRMQVPKYDFGGYNFYQARLINNDNLEDSFNYFTVTMKTLDSLISYVDTKFSFIKCDVEGHELSVIKGSQNIISKFKPIWLIEVTSDPDESDSPASELFHIMLRHGYVVYWFDGEKLRQRQKGDRSTNYFFITPIQMERFS